MTTELLSRLGHATLLLSLALLLVFALRGPWLRLFGATNVMLLWLSVPATLLAWFLPAPVHVVEGGALSTLATQPTVSSLAPTPGLVSQPASTIDSTGLLLVLWLVGAALMTAILILRQGRYRRSLGHLEALPDGSFRSQFTNIGPALVGAFRPRIVIPGDFDRRYAPDQQILVLAHERCHLKRGDAQLTLLACAMRCLFWFNPLVHLAWSRFRIDQELACDAAVLRAHPDSRRAYAEAMLSTQFAASQLPVGCTWLTGDPLRRRITMLYTRPPGKIKLVAGTVLALSASTAAAIGAWSSQEPQLRYLSAGAPQLELATLTEDPAAPRPAILERTARATAPSLASVSARHAPDARAGPAPPAPSAANVAPARPAADSTAPAVAPDPGPSSAADPQPTSEAEATADVEPPRLVEASRPSFPRTFNKPQLVSYPGMPESELPGPDWQPDGNLWRMEVRVMLNEQGKPTKASVTDNDLSSDGMVRRFESLALRAVRDWRYEPARVDGEAVTSELVMAFHFEYPAIGRLHDIGDPPYDVKRPNRMRQRTWN